MAVISSLPKVHATHMKKIFHTMVEAKQNCEAIAFRGHRLLDQVKPAGQPSCHRLYPLVSHRHA